MPACATQKMIADEPTISNLFLPVPDTDLRDFLDEVDDLARFAPEIITAIEADLDAHARKKVITEQVRQRTVKDGPIRDLCPRECR